MDWGMELAPVFSTEKYTKLMEWLKKDQMKHVIYPKGNDIFKAFRETPFAAVKVVILGQDPYINGEAHGLAFSVQDGFKITPSLNAIYKEVEADYGVVDRSTGDLTRWAQQGVLLLNTILTVRAKQSLSHANIGWEEFTDEVIAILNGRQTPIVFLLWGANARAYKKKIAPHHFVLEAAHPAAEAYRRGAGFYGCKHFTQANELLKKAGWSPHGIDWT